ncbi:MAG: glycosyltransferase family 39 protein [Verrucomicrobia bacterium]|nr:glycosyltransferase family 39 protein [Verrucomicrobiota bacterium]
MHPVKAATLTFLFGLLAFSWRIGEAPLAGTEGHRAIVAHQMVESGEWLVPKLYEVVYLRKPPLIYWLQAAAETVAGEAAEWVWRMPSVLAAAGTAAWMAWLAGMWFGRRAALFAGIATVSLVAMWSQNRAADMDAVNTLLSLVAAGCLLDALYRPSSRRVDFRWLVAALAFGGALLTKGPACLPVVLGGLAGASVMNRDRAWRSVRAWASLAGGLVLFLLWVYLVKRRLTAAGIALDDSGVEEALQRLTIGSLKTLLEAVSLPIQLVAMAMPVSWALFLTWRRSKRQDLTGVRLKVVYGAIFGAMFIGVVSGMTNPRYAYGLFPWFAVLAGAWFSLQSDWNVRPVRRLSIAALSLLGLAGIILAMVALRKAGGGMPDVALAGVLSLVLWVWGVRRGQSGPSPAMGWIAAGIILSMAVSFAGYKNIERKDRSGYRAAMELRRLVGEGATIHAAHMIMTHPEMFYYSGLTIERYLFRDRPERRDDVPEGWNVFLNREWTALSEGDLSGFSRVTNLPTHVHGTVLAWYRSPSTGTQASPPPAP